METTITVTDLVSNLMQSIYAHMQCFEEHVHPSSPTYNDAKKLEIRAETAREHALDDFNYPEFRDRIVYVRWISEYNLKLTEMIENISR